MIKSSELILNKDGSIYHLHLKPEHISDKIILVGDPGRVDLISEFLDNKEFRIHNREFVTITGTYHDTRITVLSSGIGTDNIDIVINELDALVNIDLETRKVKEEHRSLQIVRIGTSGGLQGFVPLNAFVISEKAIGFDGLLNFYAGREKVTDNDFEEAFVSFTQWDSKLASPYVVDCSPSLMEKIRTMETIPGVTISAPGFYAPQGRKLRISPTDPGLNDKIEQFTFQNHKITNYEMECSAIYGLSRLLGHHALTVCAIIANRITKEANNKYQPVIKRLVKIVLDGLSS